MILLILLILLLINYREILFLIDTIQYLIYSCNPIYLYNIYHYYMLLCIYSWANRRKNGQRKYLSKEERRNFNRSNFNRRSYSTYVPDIVKQIEEYRLTKWQHLKIDSYFYDFVEDGAIEIVIDQFWNEVMSKLDDNQFVLILFRIIYEKKGFIITLVRTQKHKKSIKMIKKR